MWLHPQFGEPRQPALVLYGEDTKGLIILYVTPNVKGDTGRREVPVTAIEGYIK